MYKAYSGTISVGALSFSFLHFRAEIPKAFCVSGQTAVLFRDQPQGPWELWLFQWNADASAAV